MKKYYKCEWEKVRDNPYGKAAMNFTKSDIQKNNHYIWLIQQNIPDDEKFYMKAHIEKIQKALVLLRQSMDNEIFNISYMHFFQGIACHIIAEQYFVDKSTIVKYNQKFILKFAAILYPQYFEWMKEYD